MSWSARILTGVPERREGGAAHGGVVGLKVAVISQNLAVVESCRAILAELCGPDFTLAVGSGKELPSQADLCIWDFVPGEADDILKTVGPRVLQSHLFLVNRGDVDALRELVPSAGINLLLKPLSAPALRAYLGEVCWRWRERDKDFAARRLRAERDEMLQCLIQANLRLQEYNQDRTTFLARSLHDFRAPLTTFSGYCSLMAAGDLGPLTTEQRDALERMQYGVRRLSRMADAMFQLSASHDFRQKLFVQPGDFRECVEKALQEITLLIDEKRLAVSVTVDGSEPLYADTGLLEQLLVHLLENACKFTPRTGSIDIKAYPFFWDRRIRRAARLDPSKDRRTEQVYAPNSFRVDIHDSGPGIPVSDTEKIFEESASYSGGRDRSGGGIGLAICRMIVRQHQGRIWAENGPAGAVFSFVLPRQRAEAGARGDGDGAESRYVE